jgi:hypothetical protein
MARVPACWGPPGYGHPQPEPDVKRSTSGSSSTQEAVWWGEGEFVDGKTKEPGEARGPGICPEPTS